MNNIVQTYYEYYEKRRPTVAEVKLMSRIIESIPDTIKAFSDSAYSYERAVRIYRQVGCGGVRTFNFFGTAVSTVPRQMFLDNPLIVTPKTAGTNKSVYYSVFVCDDIVYDCDLNTPIPYGIYCQGVNVLTMQEYVSTGRLDLIDRLTKENEYHFFGIPVREERALG